MGKILFSGKKFGLFEEVDLVIFFNSNLKFDQIYTYFTILLSLLHFQREILYQMIIFFLLYDGPLTIAAKACLNIHIDYQLKHIKIDTPVI